MLLLPDVFRNVGLEFESDEKVDEDEHGDEEKDPMSEANCQKNQRWESQHNLDEAEEKSG
jgi:hypothetical protein